MSSMCSTYSASGRYISLDRTPRGAPAPHYRTAVDALAPALFGLLTALAAIVYIAQVVA